MAGRAGSRNGVTGENEGKKGMSGSPMLLNGPVTVRESYELI